VGEHSERGVLLRAVGDVALIGRAARALIEGPGPAWRDAAGFLASADIACANIEMPVPRSPSERTAPDVSPDLVGMPEALYPFLETGLDVASVATNHIMDWGETGLLETLEALREEGVATVGAGRNLDEALEPAVLERSGLRVGFAAFTPAQRWTAAANRAGAAPLTSDAVRESLGRLPAVDVRVVSLHWGIELARYPTPDDRALARSIADMGVDLILGHHPHTLQGVERLGGAWVAYSMGNFVFDIDAGRINHSFDPRDLSAGYAVEARLAPGDVLEFRTVPTLLGPDGLATLATGEEGTRIAALIDEASRDIGEGSRRIWSEAGGKLVGHKLKVIRANVRDGGVLFALRQLANLRPRHLRLLFGYLSSRLRRKGDAHETR
jgi:poly-gamma-glutamate synthesis protein (capsule biosynthesis protein)